MNRVTACPGGFVAPEAAGTLDRIAFEEGAEALRHRIRI